LAWVKAVLSASQRLQQVCARKRTPLQQLVYAG